MNDSHTPPLIPQPGRAGLPEGLAAPAGPPGDNPEDQAPIPNLVAPLKAILRQPRRSSSKWADPETRTADRGHAFRALLCGLVYGVIVGTFSGGTQVWAAPVRSPAGCSFRPHLFAQPLYLFLPEAVPRPGPRGGRVGLGLLLSHDRIAHRLCARCFWIFSQSITVRRRDGRAAPAFWGISACFGIRFLNAASRTTPVGTVQGLDRHLPPRDDADVHGAAAAAGPPTPFYPSKRNSSSPLDGKSEVGR